VNNAFDVRGIQRIGHFAGNIQQSIEFQPLTVGQVLQCLPIQKFHGNERLAVLLTDVINGANVRMVQSRSRLRFPLEACQRLRVFGDIFWEKF